jgi:glycosyltransferase involved in cell wall biosynthesis
MLDEKKIDYRNVFGLDDDAVREEYLAADIVTFCSVYEGFGLPIIEAQAMRTPVITSDLEPMRSVAGSGAILVDPLDVDSIRTAIESVIGDEKLRSELVERGTDNVKRFSPDVIAQKYAELYREVAEGSRPGQ